VLKPTAQVVSPGESPAVSGSGPVVGSRRMLIVKLGAIGDVVMAIPAVAARHAAGYTIDWVCSETVEPILRLYSWITVIPVPEAKLLRGPRGERLAGMLRLWKELRTRTKVHGPYDSIATLYYDRRYRLLSLPLRSRIALRLSRTDRRFMLLPGRHHTDEYDRILSGRPDGEAPAQLAPVSPGALPRNTGVRAGEEPRVVLVPAGARNALRDDVLRRWPMEHYVQLAEALLRRGVGVTLVGGPDDLWASPYFRECAASAWQGQFENRIGQLSLVETLALLHSATVTVTHDTGPLHLAGLTSTAIVGLFGPTDPHGRLPQRDNAIAIWGGEGFACRPCYDGRDYAACLHNGCLAQITPSLVLEQIERLLTARQDGRDVPRRVITPEPAGLIQILLEPARGLK
jgi:heptosyltransferase II